jgi:hypothetical protein
MSKGRHLFKKTDLARAVRGAQELDLPVTRVRITSEGDIELEIGAPQLKDSATDEWKGRRDDGHSHQAFYPAHGLHRLWCRGECFMQLRQALCAEGCARGGGGCGQS